MPTSKLLNLQYRGLYGASYYSISVCDGKPEDAIYTHDEIKTIKFNILV
jgi:hypothetical protein